MGAYMYCNKPSQCAVAIVEHDDGTQTAEAIALFRYAYKPTHSWDGAKYNQRWRFQSGAAACAAAWARTERASGRRIPALGVHFDQDGATVYAAGRKDANWVFLTGGECEVVDDYATAAKVKLVRWVKLPKGIKEGAMPEPEMHERITPSMVLQVKVGQGERPYPAFSARLADEATGETMNGWWLFSNAEQLERHALKLGVLAKPAPADAA